MNGARSFRLFKTCLTDRFAAIGFAAASDVFVKKINDTVVALELQRDAKRSTKDAVVFTVNVGVSIDLLRSSVVLGAESADVPLPAKCHWRERLGRLLSARSDLWWSVRDEQTALLVCDEIASGLTDQALPEVERIASSEVLVQLWQDGKGRGLTDYERRSNLAALLCALNRMDDARTAIQDLEDAALGKAWEASARYTASELRKLLSS